MRERESVEPLNMATQEGEKDKPRQLSRSFAFDFLRARLSSCVTQFAALPDRYERERKNSEQISFSLQHMLDVKSKLEQFRMHALCNSCHEILILMSGEHVLRE